MMEASGMAHEGAVFESKQSDTFCLVSSALFDIGSKTHKIDVCEAIL